MRALVRSSHPPQSNAVRYLVRLGADPRDLLRFKRAQFGHVMDSSALRHGAVIVCDTDRKRLAGVGFERPGFLAKLQA